MPKRTPAVPAAKPTAPAPPAVIIPPPPEPSEPANEPAQDVTIEVEPVSKSKALRELLDATPVDLATCAGMSPAKLDRYLAARKSAEQALAS